MKRNLQWAVIFMAALFSFQVLDIPPARNAVNSKTCCGKTVCMCSHAKGAHCPIRRPAHHGHSAETKKPAVPAQGLYFTKAPCASHTPKTVLRRYLNDFAIPVSSSFFSPRQQGTISVPSLDALLLLREQGIDRPPRSIPFSF